MSGTVAGLFQGVSGFLQPLANRSFGSLCAVLYCLACLGCDLLNGVFSFFAWALILRSICVL
jgi:hypothetical protein